MQPPTTIACHILILTAGLLTSPVHCAVTMSIQVDKPGPAVQPSMWGVFFEDINQGADGGLYAELVKNRSFEFTDPMMGWKKTARTGAKAGVTIRTEEALNQNNPHYLQARVETAGDGIELVNEGFHGMGVKKGEAYDFSCFARLQQGRPKVQVEVLTPEGRSLGRAQVDGFTRAWKKHSAKLRVMGTEARAQLHLRVEGPGTLDLDMVSLFPRETWRGRPGGLRADLVQMLAELRPGFVRFPGGCIVEGRHLPLRYQWKTTIGAPEERRLLINRWNDEFQHRPAPDYFQSFGLGFFEYFLMCEDIGAEPLPILNCGMACQFNSGELTPLEQLEPFIQDALDLVEFATGPATSPWGKRRAALGHAKPFHLRLLGVGNEQWGPQYLERYERFAKVLKPRYPNLRLVTSAGPDPDGEKFDYLWPNLRALGADLVDEHYYRPPAWFLDNTRRYDRYSRSGPKIFAGEYAAQSVRTVSPDNRNNWGCALAEAAMMTGFERNADVVHMASYAPLFAHEEGWQWRPNLIWFDNLRVYGTPNYYVQQLFSLNRGDVVLPVSLSGAPLATNQEPRFFASATYEQKSGEVILKAVNATDEAVTASLRLAGARQVSSQGTVLLLAGATLQDENSLSQPRKVAPVKQTLRAAGPRFSYAFAPRSLTVVRLEAKR
jgi:alpha-L-arabinofuranosidase